MRRKLKPIDVSVLVDADDIDRTTKKGEMRKLYSAIHEKLTTGGWSAKDMVEWLGKHGMDISVELFRVYLRDLDIEHGYERSTAKLAKKRDTHKDQVNSEAYIGHLTAGNPPQSRASQELSKADQVQERTPVTSRATSRRRPIILSDTKGIYSELKPSPVDGMVDLTQK